jgi:HAD superfamily hydrolase (TIGR01509 family)
VKAKPELIIFDLGRVLIDFDFKKVIANLRKHSPLAEEAIHKFFATTPLWDSFERGTIQPQEFFVALVEGLQLTGLTFESFAPMWNEIFQEMPETIEILSRLRGKYKLAMVSNVNPMHWEHVKARHGFMTWFDVPIASYAVGHRKPELEIFRLALKTAGVEASRAIFIDDVEAHIHAARKLGIRGHHFSSAKQLREDLRDLLE